MTRSIDQARKLENVRYDIRGRILDKTEELEEQGQIGSTADVHYSFMGAGLPPSAYERGAAQVAGLLKQDKVDAVFLTPV